MTISAASFATSVPLPIAKPTSAFFKAKASLTPSPVIPTTKSNSLAILTSLLLSWGIALAITLILGRIFLIFSSLIISSLSWVIIKSSAPSISPISLAIPTAVSLLSPVTITWIPAFFTKSIPKETFSLTSSFNITNPISVILLVVSLSVLIANANNLILLLDSFFNLSLTSFLLSIHLLPSLS